MELTPSELLRQELIALGDRRLTDGLDLRTIDAVLMIESVDIAVNREGLPGETVAQPLRILADAVDRGEFHPSFTVDEDGAPCRAPLTIVLDDG